ncbi:MAG: 3,4-dihydroxy-2-butanone-4-phosphate synthase [Rudaea sp.]|uniref:3,4-dihydroxy-2-butanone-4-phosphate synthase n=1 Tax=unclassified Rudaea TaxID=2627037 RepID=UPI0010F7269D|nr:MULTISPECIES: 3,4-dihydroxy-2-butanone-4-phosphate synthase [unclassified Rudaea]MBN8885857.1 3,4-dihydroxy-2-butanone-4-phosphate synthase [Rudaea sp.]MBR0347262.1 3,4-dihydroxy-2-butanone-4-phosphate synthase [Rudaea sp.]
MQFDTIEDLVADIRAGRMVIVADDEDRENEGDLIMAAQAVTEESIAFIVRHSSGIICQPMLRARLEELQLPQMVTENSESHRTAFTISVDYRHGTTTGISAADRARTIRALADPTSQSGDFARPGHIFPLRYSEGGVLTRAGHTEATIDLVRLAGLPMLSGILVEIVNDDGTMKRGAQLIAFAREHGLKVGTIADLIRHRLQTEKTVARVFEREVETEFGPFRLIGYRDALSSQAHFALVRGKVDDGAPVLTRVHVRDTLTDVLHLTGTPCGMTISAALRRVAAEGRGVVVVLADAKEAASALERLDTDAKREGDAAHDGRQHGLGAQILADLGVRRLTVLGTPRRFLGLGGFGLEIAGYEESSVHQKD